MNDYLIFRDVAKGNLNNIKEKISKNKKLINLDGPGGNKLIHAACMIGDKKIINYLLTIDDKMLNFLNSSLSNCYHLLAIIDVELLLYFMKDYPPDNVHQKDYKGRTILICYLLFNKFEEKFIIKLKDYGCSLIYPKDINNLSFLIYKKCDLVKKLSKYFPLNVNLLHFHTPISFITLKNNDLECLKTLVTFGLDINLESDTDNIVSLCIKEKNLQFLKFLITLDIDYTFVDSFEYTYLHILLFDDFYNKQDDLVKHFIKNVNLNHQDITGTTCMHLIFEQNKYDKFKDVLKNKKIDLNITNKEGKKPISYISKKDLPSIKNYLKNNLVNSKKLLDEVTMVKPKVPIFTTFRGFFHTVLSAIHYLQSKHRNIGYPLCSKTLKNNKSENVYMDELLNYEFNEDTLCLTCGRIFFKDENNYYINDNFENCIKNVIHKDYILFYLVIQLENSTHANVILIDKGNKVIERFEPAGSHFTKNYNDNILDKIISNILTSSLLKITKNLYTYRTPLEFQSIYDFQNISKEEYYSYEGEALGFCVAWVIWYVEHKLINENVSSKSLIYKLKNKLKYDKIEIIDHIRGYADMLQKYKINLFLKYKLDKKKFYRIQADKNLRNKFYINLLYDLKNFNK